MERLGYSILLLLLIGCGGSSNPGMGACCFADGSCTETTSQGCASGGGTYRASQSCASVCPDRDELAQRALELELALRCDVESYLWTVGIVGRDFWDLNDVDPEVTSELLGQMGKTVSSSSHLTTRSFLARYKVVQLAARLIEAAGRSTVISIEEENGLIGYAKTFQAYALLLVANRQFSNGILPADSLDDPDPANFLNYADSLQHIADLLDEGALSLTNGGPAFPFLVTYGFAGFETPATFRQFNRALSARVRLYQGDKAGAISGIAGSFFNINGDMETGPSHFFETTFGDPMYFAPDLDLFTVHSAFLLDAELGDPRPDAKSRFYIPTPTFFVPIALNGLIGDRQVKLVGFDTEAFPIISNAELILIYAEAQIGSSVNESLAAINRVRNAVGLGNYIDATDDASMLVEVLKQRRYALYGQGHRWIDMRRVGKIDEIAKDRVGDIVHGEFPRPDAAVLTQIPGL